MITDTVSMPTGTVQYLEITQTMPRVMRRGVPQANTRACTKEVHLVNAGCIFFSKFEERNAIGQRAETQKEQ